MLIGLFFEKFNAGSLKGKGGEGSLLIEWQGYCKQLNGEGFSY